MADAAFKRMTPEQYLRSEREAQEKHVFVDGFAYPLHAQARPSELGCRPYVADMKLRAGGWRNFFTPT